MIPESEWTKSMREFVGTQFNTPKGGVLTVTGVVGKQGYTAVFSLECSVCSKDSELWPCGSIISTKGRLMKSSMPCGCSNSPHWTKSQYGTIINRICLERGYEFQGFVGDWQCGRTHLRLYNTSNGNTLESTTINNFLHNDIGLNSIRTKLLIPQTEREQQINNVFAVEGGEFIGWKGEYNGAFSKFNWICSEDHPCETSVNGFLNIGNRCSACDKIKQREAGNIYGYFSKRTQEQDYLYIIHFKKGNYIKVGRSFDVEQRLKGSSGLLKLSGHTRNDIEILSIYTGKHQDVYNTEQWIHEELTERGFYHEDSEWTVETFDTDCKDILFKLLEESGLELTTEY